MVTNKASAKRRQRGGPAARAPKRGRRPKDAWDRILEAARRIPEEDLAKFPPDYASRADEYLEGMTP